MGFFDLFKKNLNQPEKQSEKPAGKHTVNTPEKQGGNVQLPPGVQLPPDVHMVSREEFEKIKKGQDGETGETDRRKTAVLHYQLAENCRKEGRKVQARNYYLHAVENIRSLAESKRARGDLLLLYECSAQLGNSYLDDEDYRNAIPHFERALSTTVLQILVEPNEYQHYMNAGQCSQMAAFCYIQEGDYRKAHQTLTKGLSLVREGEDEANNYFMHSNREHRIFDSYHAEACLQLARLQAEHDVQGDESTYDLCAECIKVLNTIKTLMKNPEERKYDLANGVYLCALCLEDGARREMLSVALSFCNNFLEGAENRIRFLKLQKEIRKAQE